MNVRPHPGPVFRSEGRKTKRIVCLRGYSSELTQNDVSLGVIGMSTLQVIDFWGQAKLKPSTRREEMTRLQSICPVAT